MYLDYLSQLEQTINKTREFFASADFNAANKGLHEISKLVKLRSFYETVSEVHGIVAERTFQARFNIALHSYYGLINKVYIAEAYQLIEDCNRCILKADFSQAALNHELALKRWMY
jgi:predicted AlkP superfamily phosphohydrolase/phosphomutase